QLIASLPEPNARLYEETFGAAAQALLDADEPDRQQARRQVVRRFFYTTAGADAAWKLAAAQMDRGALLAAGRLLERLQNSHPRARQFEPQLSLRLILCYWRSGETERAADVLLRAAQADPDLKLFDHPLGPLASTEQARGWLAQHLGQVRPGDAVGL